MCNLKSFSTDSNCLARQYCGALRPFHMRILDNTQREVTGHFQSISDRVLCQLSVGCATSTIYKLEVMGECV